jgi:diguanylate cyclase (GGDEF)-like protein/PAS domain S-box-containing protein
MTDEPEPPAGVAQHFEDAYMRAPVGRASLTPDGTIVRGNYSFADLFGRAFVDLEDAVLGEIAPALATALGETTTEHEIETERRGGARLRLRVTVAPMRAEDGRIVGYDLYATDLTELRAAEAEIRRAEQEYRALIAYSSDIITVLEADGSWRSSSAAGTRVLGFPEGYDPPGGIFSLLHPDDVDLAQQAFSEVLAGERTPDDSIVIRARSADRSQYFHFETVARNLLNDPAVRGIVVTSRDVTERVHAEEALEAQDARFASLVERATDVTTVVEERDGEPRISWASPSIERVLGYLPDEIIGKDPLMLVHPDDIAPMFEASAVAVEAGDTTLVEYRAVAKDGSVRLFEAITSDLRDDPSVQGFVTNARDITERRAAERQAEQLTEVLELSIEVVVLSDEAGHIVWANQRARDFLGLGASHHVGELSSVESREKLRDVVMPFVRRHGVWTGELTLRTTAGDEVPVIATVQGHREQGEIVLVSTIAHDITELKAAQNRLQYEATHDPLTALPNRAMLQEVGEQALGRAARRGSTSAVLFLDLDHFKEVNDTLGHDAGDRVLVELARRLRVGVRTGDLVARLGGDEFCVLCEGVESDDEVLDLGQRICDVVSIPISVHGREVQIGTSVGIAVDVGGQGSMGSLLRNADIALYRAKRSGGSKVAVFDEASMSSDDEISEHLDPQLG